MHNRIFNFLKATIKSLIVAFLFIVIICIVYAFTLKEKLETVTWVLEMLTVSKTETQTVKPILTEERLQNRPTIGSKYGQLKIEKINVDLPIYYGESLDVLKNGIGHHLDSYFPGEGGSILCMGHNYKKYLQRLPEVEKGDKIQVETDYGTFEYTVYDTKIVHETQVSAAPIQKEEEIFMLYTCYPTYGLGHATQRLIVYAK